MKQSIIIWTSLLFFLAPLISPLWGQECLAPSPTVEAGGDPFAPVRARDLTRSEHEQVRTLLQSLRGDWIGSGEALHCKSLRDPQDKETNLYRLRARVDTDHFGNMLLTVDLHDIDQRISHQELFRLYLKDGRFRTEHDGGAGDVELKLLTANRVHFLRRVVINAGASRGSTRKEYNVMLEGDAKNFSLTRRVYTQGRFSTGEDWQFHRR